MLGYVAGLKESEILLKIYAITAFLLVIGYTVMAMQLYAELQAYEDAEQGRIIDAEQDLLAANVTEHGSWEMAAAKNIFPAPFDSFMELARPSLHMKLF